MKKRICISLILGLICCAFIQPVAVKANDRSLKSWFIEQYFWLKRDKSYYSEQDEAEFQKYVNSAGEASNKGYTLDPSLVNGTLVKEEKYQMTVYSWNDKNDPNQKVILYLHGGSYLNNPTTYHIDMLKKISSQLDAKIVLPIYPKAPKYAYHQVMPLLVDLYQDIYNSKNKNAKNITLMGDSAGGGLALGLARALTYEPEPYPLAQPKDIILLSPWLDVSMSHPEIPSYESTDPILSAWGLKRVGALWAGGEDNVHHQYVSPKNGPLDKLAPITLFVGTREIFYPDVRDFEQRLSNENLRHNYFVGNGMNHAYPIYPISEADKAQRDIVQIINRPA